MTGPGLVHFDAISLGQGPLGTFVDWRFIDEVTLCEHFEFPVQALDLLLGGAGSVEEVCVAETVDSIAERHLVVVGEAFAATDHPLVRFTN